MATEILFINNNFYARMNDIIVTSKNKIYTLDDSDPMVKKHLNDPTSYARTIMKEINFDRLYDKFFRDKNDLVILDIGANVGLFTIYAHDSSKRIVAVEPTESHQYIFKQLTKSIKDLVLDTCALSDSDDMIKFYMCEDNTTMNSIVNTYEKYTEVQGLTLKSLMDRHGLDYVDLCKIDIEGSEMKAITKDTLDAVKNRVRNIYIEIHDTPGSSQSENMLKMNMLFKECGYETNIVDSRTIFARRIV